MKVLFHENQLGLRGTTVALYDYAHYNETILGNTSYIAYPYDSDKTALDKFKDRFNDRMIEYKDFASLQYLAKSYDIKHAYFIKYGFNDGKLIPGINNFVHAVFDCSDKHGDVYCGVSKWLGDKYKVDYLPHIVSLPDIKDSYREHLNIPEDALVFGRYGGYDQFDVSYLEKVISHVLEANNNIYFLLMNTKPFSINNPRIIYIDSTTDVDTKTAFINTCDAMLHGRTEGETFGLSICEFLHQNKPIISNIECRDRNHIEILKDKGFYYEDALELFSILTDFKKNNYDFKNLIEEYKPENVINKFKEVFLDKRN